MKQYRTLTEDGDEIGLGRMSFSASPDNRHYRNMLREIADGRSELLDYAAPVISNEERRRGIIVSGGYGSSNEQLDMIAEPGGEARWRAHRAAVDVAFPVD